LRQFIATEFNSMFDRDYAARLVLGAHGRGASDADVKLFADALADGLMSRYGSSLLDLNTKLKVRVKSETALPNGRGVRVSSEFLRQGGAPIPVDYFMRNTGTGWKVFDVMVEGVSFVQTFRTQFDAPLSRKTIPQVAADLKAGKLQADATTDQ
jgi:phospholipid transport system substrate-binding protein